MNAADLKPGIIVRGPMLPEPIEVLVVTPLGDVVKLTGAGQKTGQVHQRVLHADQLKLLDASPETEPFDGDPLHFKLGVEAARLGLAYEYDPYFSLSIARVDPLPHQLEAVYDYFLKLPRIRFLLADDPGAGKTIMAGLLLKELKVRGLVTRTLIVAPANLTFQWQRELKDKFREQFDVMRGEVLRTQYGQNPWQERNQVVTSVSWISRVEDAKESLLRSSWDLVIVDEAHKMSAYSSDKKTLAFQIGEALSQRTDHFLRMRPWLPNRRPIFIEMEPAQPLRDPTAATFAQNLARQHRQPLAHDEHATFATVHSTGDAARRFASVSSGQLVRRRARIERARLVEEEMVADAMNPQAARRRREFLRMRFEDAAPRVRDAIAVDAPKQTEAIFLVVGGDDQRQSIAARRCRQRERHPLGRGKVDRRAAIATHERETRNVRTRLRPQRRHLERCDRPVAENANVGDRADRRRDDDFGGAIGQRRRRDRVAGHKRSRERALPARVDELATEHARHRGVRFTLRADASQLIEQWHRHRATTHQFIDRADVARADRSGQRPFLIGEHPGPPNVDVGGVRVDGARPFDAIAGEYESLTTIATRHRRRQAHRRMIALPCAVTCCWLPPRSRP